MTVVRFLAIKFSSTHKKLSAVSSSNWIVSELFHFSNHSKLITFRVLILRGQKQPLRGVPMKRCSEKLTPMPKCDFDKVALQLY